MQRDTFRISISLIRTAWRSVQKGWWYDAVVRWKQRKRSCKVRSLYKDAAYQHPCRYTDNKHVQMLTLRIMFLLRKINSYGVKFYTRIANKVKSTAAETCNEIMRT